MRQLEQFQEQPQLLDPYLQKIVPPLAVAFIQCLQYAPAAVKSSTISHLLMSLSAAICRLLYTFCKIRGEKVIVRFLSTETKHLELLLSAIESGICVDDTTETVKRAWTWEERYTTLLWLSQLLLAPFDLATISSSSSDEDAAVEAIPDFEFTYPEEAPGVSRRVISLALRHLSSSGREREAAKLLLVRIALRPDMQQIGILEALVRWAMKALCGQFEVVKPVHHYIGVLSFLAGLLSSSTGTNDMDRYLSEIFDLVERILPDGDVVFKSIHESAVARKSAIKIYRGVAILLLRTNLDEVGFSIVQGTIVALLGFLADDSTPVRLSASKALSMVVPKLDSDMSMQVVQAIVDELEAGISWHKPDLAVKSADSQRYSFSNANVLLWHGHVLTLSQLLYRRAIPVTEISSVLVYVVAGLSFEKRDVSGLSTGTNVRDAACFGVWALARRYTTAELNSVHLQCEHPTAYRIHSDKLGATSPTPIVQQLGIELIVSACLDPAGNIRRGSSAALQELVGRHPDAILNGINLVQVIDYHAIARRSTALQEVAFSAAGLSHIYFDAIISALLGWRGVRDTNPSVRRDVAEVFGTLIWSRQSATGSSGLSENLEAPVLQILARYSMLPARDLHERHGLLLCAAAIMDGFHADRARMQSILGSQDGREAPSLMKRILVSIQNVLRTAETSMDDRKPTELLVESVCSLVLSTFPLMRANIFLCHWEALQTGDFDVSKSRRDLSELCNTPLWPPKTAFDPTPALENMQSAIEGGFFEDREIVNITRRLLKHFLNMKEPETIEVVSRTCANYVFLLDRATRELLILEWVDSLDIGGRIGRSTDGKIASQILFYILPILTQEGDSPQLSSLQKKVIKQLQAKWTANRDNVTRVWLLRCLRCSDALQKFAETFVTWLEDGLNDYTITSQGDVGRHVRIEGLITVTSLGTSYVCFHSKNNIDVYRRLFGLVLRSAAEKNDSVREAAKGALILGIPPRLVLKSCPMYFLIQLVSNINPSSPISLPSHNCILKFFYNSRPLTTILRI
jgi:hypothetical protein